MKITTIETLVCHARMRNWVFVKVLTDQPGLFGWGDNSRHEVHVFDDQGRKRPDFAAPTITRDAQTFTELRLPEDFSAAIVRRP